MFEGIKELFKVYGSILYVALYPLVIVFVIVFSGLGVYNWFLIAGLLTPPTVLWYVVARKRAINYLKLLLSHSWKWDLDKAVDEYVKIFKKDYEKKS